MRGIYAFWQEFLLLSVRAQHERDIRHGNGAGPRLDWDVILLVGAQDQALCGETGSDMAPGWLGRAMGIDGRRLVEPVRPVSSIRTIKPVLL